MMRGQLTAEMLILLVLAIALAVLAYGYMSGAVKSAGNTAMQGATSAAAENNPYFCSSDFDCQKFSNVHRCVNNTCSP